MARRKIQRKRRRGKKSHGNFLHAVRRLKKLKTFERQKAMNMANASFIRQFCNALKKLKHAKLSSKKRKKLQRYKKEISHLLNRKTSMSKRRHMLSQKGGGGLLNTILAAIPIVGPLLGLLGGK